MSAELPQTNAKGKKLVTKKLSTGQRIQLSTQDDKTLKVVYDYLAGYAARRSIETQLDAKKNEVNHLHNALPPSSRLQIQLQPRNFLASYSLETSTNNHNAQSNQQSDNPADAPQKSEVDVMLDNYYKAKAEQLKLEEKLKAHVNIDHKISFRDLELILKTLGSSFTKKQIEHMIWEVDENIDSMIDYDELQLTYFRNITDTTGMEPCLFFKVLEFLIFDASHKGYIIEDDCMEILYGRYGGLYLEREMKLLFGSKLRAEGGDGTLNLEAYLMAVLNRIGRRALVF